MTRAVYITGTDTGVGKTLVSATLLAALNAANIPANGMKPVASGCEKKNGEWRNSDAEQLRDHSAQALPYELVNPFALPDPIAPHLAAAMAKSEIRIETIALAFAELYKNSNAVVVEGVGGWAVPFSSTTMQSDLVRTLKLPVIVVVGLRLGCINHALLTERAIAADGCALMGWVANRIDPEMRCADENLAALRERISAPLLGILPHSSTPSPRALAPLLGDAVKRICELSA
jgi:dethiobiotin synthetase